MKKHYFINAGIIIYLFVGNIVPISAQETVEVDSLNNFTSTKSVSCKSHNFKFKEFLIPTTLFGLSALYVNTPCLITQKEKIQECISTDGKRKTYIDDYLQYSPMIAVYGLNALGVNGKHCFKDRTILLAMSYATMGIAVNSMKRIFKEKRPDSNARKSFPSGHTATVFMGAEFLYKEYSETKPYIGYIGYSVAVATGYLRIYNNRHYFNDVIAGACIGIMSTKFAYWLYPKIFKNVKCSQNATIIGAPYYTSQEIGLSVNVQF